MLKYEFNVWHINCNLALTLAAIIMIYFEIFNLSLSTASQNFMRVVSINKPRYFFFKFPFLSNFDLAFDCFHNIAFVSFIFIALHISSLKLCVTRLQFANTTLSLSFLMKQMGLTLNEFHMLGLEYEI